MKFEKIKPIPKNMIKTIRKYDKKTYIPQDGHTRYYAYLTKNDGELVKVTIAVKNRYKKWYCKQVAIHGVHSDRCFGQDLWFYYIGGYVTKWSPEDYSETQKPFDPGDWGYAPDKMFDPCSPVLNKDYAVKKYPEYRFSAVDLYPYGDVIKYLRYYEKYPQIEYLTKSGLIRYVYSKTILCRIGKDKIFAKWLMRNKTEIVSGKYYVAAIINAYKKNIPLKTANAIYKTSVLLRDKKYKDIRDHLKGRYYELATYLDSQNTSIDVYSDYLNACIELGLDTSLDKNCFPKDFKRWHNIRIDEYNSQKLERDEINRKEFYKNFYNIAMKYIGLEYKKRSAYIVIIARKPSDLITEGEKLRHCVGKMNYDRKFVREDSLIFFIRETLAPDKPFVTVEYSPSQKKILQCYGCLNSPPKEDVLDFIYKKWLPFANRQIKKTTA